MQSKPHPRFSRIVLAVKTLVPRARLHKGSWYRCVETSFAHEIVSGEGARRFGGRWNPIASFRTVYLSESPETALQEYLARARRMKWPDRKSLPMIMAVVDVTARRVLDLRLPETAAAVEPLLRAERVHWRSIQSKREATSQAIGRAVFEEGCQGLLVASQQVTGGANLVLYPDNFATGDTLSTPKLRIVS